MKTKTKKRLAGAAGILIILGLLLAVDGFTGDPLSRAWAQWRALHRAGLSIRNRNFMWHPATAGSFLTMGSRCSLRPYCVPKLIQSTSCGYCFCICKNTTRYVLFRSLPRTRMVLGIVF
mgnify:CR=1 FL=1